MKTKECQDLVRKYKYQEPFQHFVLEMKDGKTLEIDDPNAVGFNGNFIAFAAPDFMYHVIPCKKIVAIKPLEQEATP